jgi:rubrerythrin
MTTKYTKEKLEEAAKNSFSYMGVLRWLGLKQAGGTQCHIKRKLLQYNIDISHFTGQAHLKGKHSSNKLSASQILIKRNNNRRQDAYKLRRALIESGIVYECEICKNNGVWNDKKLTLQVDHKNGDWQDDKLENLRFLCPNCHQQTSNFGSRPKTKVIKEKVKKSRPSKLRNKITKEELAKLLWEKPTSQIAKDFNVSDNGIAKLAKQWKLTKPPRGYWAKINKI